ncbi:winged helix-turn-helix transcriptional regulator [Haloferax sp. DFSO52]|uniref:winged helix-turn-helix transcriptional regulator n=1 Tax=Haloferax sp. DFSO52 TaxID=3388505 RepID=UPI003A888413
MSETRIHVADHITHNPGVHFNELVRALDLAPGQVQHHIRKLLSDERVNRTELYGRTHYYPPEFDDWERGALALVRRETARDIVGCLFEHESARPDDVADAIGVARSTLEWHLNHLTERDVVRKERDLHNHVTLVLMHPTRTATLLDDVSPSLPERFVDRFDRLIDTLVEG